MSAKVSFSTFPDASIEQAEGQSRQHAQIEQIPQAMGWLSSDGRVVACNAALRALLGFPPEEKPQFLDFLAGGSFPWPRETATPNDPVRRVECELHPRTGQTIPAALRIRRVRDETEEFDLLLVEDLSELRKAQQHVAQAQRLESVGVLAGGIAHDLNNTLSPILLGIDMLRLGATPAQAQMMDNMLASAQRAAGLVTQMLMFAKRKDMKLARQEVALLLAELQRITTLTFPKSIKVDIDAGAGLPAVIGDEVHLMRVLLNLALNARDAMPQGGTLKIRAEPVEVDATHTASVGEVRAGRYVRFTVADTGTGIPPEVREQIFDPFFTTKGPDKGTGLGLSAVMGIVESHLGFLSLYSEVGRGTRFHVYIPRAEGGEAAAVPAAPVTENAVGAGRLALVADDEQIVRTVLAHALELLGFRVLSAEDGTQALGLCVKHRRELGLLITDMHMPHLDGLNLLRAVRRMAPDLPTVVMSGRFLEDEKKALSTLGNAHLLAKPFNQSDLSHGIRAALRAG